MVSNPAGSVLEQTFDTVCLVLTLKLEVRRFLARQRGGGGGCNMWGKGDTHSRSCDLRPGGNLKPSRAAGSAKIAYVLLHLVIFVGHSEA